MREAQRSTSDAKKSQFKDVKPCATSATSATIEAYREGSKPPETQGGTP